jgi:alkylhydroperoxidase/carboxymuconolactone decarboxylase family protein YurZ
MTTEQQDAELEQELERTLKMRGFRYGLHEFVAAVGGVEALKAHNGRVSYDKPTHLDPMTKELIRVAVQATGGYPHEIIMCHMLMAQKHGASPEQIMEVANMASGAGHMRGLEAWRRAFRPDLKSIYRVAALENPDAAPHVIS